MKRMPYNEFVKMIGKPYQAYTGHESGCRCGCRGNYYDEGEVGFTRALNKISKINPEVIFDVQDSQSREIQVGEAISEFIEGEKKKEVYVDLYLPNDRTITIFFETEKKPEPPKIQRDTLRYNIEPEDIDFV